MARLLRGRSSALRRGVTLVELVLVLAVLGVGAALVLPTFITPRPAQATLASVAQQARARAIATAQPLTLRLAADGRWLLAASGGERQTMDSGAIAEPGPVVLDVSPLGACTIRFGRVLRWDAARCSAEGAR
ncbi:MAG: prepilin-type N-terminal cleavage/methylation domain-containing protein [Gemmatimonadaceae bacterium]|nr:prepilin-type N-terminal cleavage/methylation domain-containing protein [Gemmatimonadaceae bacterium]